MNENRFSKLYILDDLNDDLEREEKKEELGLSINNKVNVVSGEKLRDIQGDTLNHTKDFLAKTFGPMGSNTKIVSGTNARDVSSSYSKDGLKVLSNIINSGPIESSIVEELIEITKHVEKNVGDGTTSSVILSAIVFDRLRNIEKKHNCPPYSLMRKFDSVVDAIKKEILSRSRAVTLDDIYSIAMVSTNGNTEIASDIKKIYEEYGLDVDLNVGISNNEQTVVKVYDGLTITEGYSDPVYINNKGDNTSEIHNANVYHFADPVDDMYMISLVESIINHNIYEPINNDEAMIPTVIVCPRISSDMSSILKQLANQLYQFDAQNAENVKPPILIITNVIASDEVIMDDIANLCGCKTIHKYIDKDVFNKEVEVGLAATVDTVWDFAGKAELVVADSKKTKFINPEHMVTEDGSKDPIYTAMVNFLETSIEEEKTADKNANDIGLLKKRLSALKANMVDYLVGGISITDRDMKKDLAEDAIKNCRSASMYGVGYAANYEGLRAALAVYENNENVSEIVRDIERCILLSYIDLAKILYGTVIKDEDIILAAIDNSLEYDLPYDISSGLESVFIAATHDNGFVINVPNGDEVLCSIMLDINILDTISKIITRMVTCNQCLLQSSSINIYE